MVSRMTKPWINPSVALLLATLGLIFWTFYIRAANEVTTSLTNLGEFGFEPYLLGLAAQELVLPLFLLFLLSRTTLYQRVTEEIATTVDQQRLGLILVASTLLFYVGQYGLITAQQDRATTGFFIVFVAGLLGGWQIGLVCGLVGMASSGLIEYWGWKTEAFNLFAYVQYATFLRMESMAAVWIGFCAGMLRPLLSRSQRLTPWLVVLIYMVAEVVIAVVIYFAHEEVTYYIDRLFTNIAMSALAVAATTLMARNVQVEATRHRAEQAQIELAQTTLALTQTKLALAQAEVRALHAQINPHFFFNALNTIRYFIRTDPTTARDLLTKLSEIFQRTLSAGQFVTLREEVEHVEAYLALEKARLDERLQIIWTNFAKDQLDQLVPTLILQPIVENAVIHGLAPQTEGGTLHIVINKIGPDLLLQVDDNGAGFDRTQVEQDRATPSTVNPTPRSAIGLRNVDERLRMLYGEEYRLLVESEPGHGTRVILRIPLTGVNGTTDPNPLLTQSATYLIA
jgi:LytS/YehU family sensor histidine kinase